MGKKSGLYSPKENMSTALENIKKINESNKSNNVSQSVVVVAKKF